MNTYTSEQKNYIFEIYYLIKSSKTLSFANDFVRLFNDRFSNTPTNIQALRNVIKNKHQVLIIVKYDCNCHYL